MGALKRRNIVISGASSGLGQGMARAFAAKGANLALFARRSDRLEALRDELLAANPGITVVLRTVDVNDHESVFAAVKEIAGELGSIDRFIVNAGLGKGQPLGTGYFKANAQTANTNFIGALAQIEAALEVLRKQGNGHLVLISSMSALRGLPRNLTAYAASKAAVAAIGEGLSGELRGTGIKVSTIFPGYIRSEMNEKIKKMPFLVDTETGVKALVDAIEKEPVKAHVPRWPWAPLSVAMRALPASLVAKMS
jgi:short-subunit dehydrogenase